MVKNNERLISLDVFRGIIIGVVLLDNPGTLALFPEARHAEWHGWTPADLIFPFFLFIVGVAMIYSFSSQERKGTPKAEMYKKIIFRAALLFAIGLAIEIFPVFRIGPFRLVDFSTLRIMGVLQRIALCYLISSVIYLEFRKSSQLWIWAGGMLAFYWIVMMLVPVPGYGAGNLTIEGNLATYIDNLVLGAHTWRPGWDPEGLLSTIPATCTVLFGLLTGRLIKEDNSKRKKVFYLLLFGTIGTGAGLIFDTWFPINKNLWTSSYVLLTTGLALYFLGFCYWLIEVQKIKWWTGPFRILGINTLVVYVCSSLVAKMFLMLPNNTVSENTTLDITYNTLVLPFIRIVYEAPILFSLLYLFSWFVLMNVLYQKKIFIRV